MQQVAQWVDKLIEFGVTYGFQILGALLFRFAGLKAGGWLALKILTVCEKRASTSPSPGSSATR
ncbi:MAG: hypothetical protein VW268_06720 [Rhodospirillaceae bacterium]